MAKAKAPDVASAKRIRALLDSRAGRQKKQEARQDLRMRLREHNIKTTERMNQERLRSMRAETPLTARTVASMIMPSQGTLSVGSARMSVGQPMSMASLRPMTVELSPRSIARSASSSRPASTVPMSSRSGSHGSVGSLVRQFEGLGNAGGAPARRPARAERDLSRYNR
jgi:hypothetical protein